MRSIIWISRTAIQAQKFVYKIPYRRALIQNTFARARRATRSKPTLDQTRTRRYGFLYTSSWGSDPYLPVKMIELTCCRALNTRYPIVSRARLA